MSGQHVLDSGDVLGIENAVFSFGVRALNCVQQTLEILFACFAINGPDVGANVLADLSRASVCGFVELTGASFKSDACWMTVVELSGVLQSLHPV